MPIESVEGSRAPAVSIVIRARNEDKHIRLLLTKIRQQTVKDVEVIVVDSGSTDKTLQIISEFPEVFVCSIEAASFTFGYALNVGCRIANAPFLVFASAHTYPEKDDWLEKLVAPLKNSSVALSYGRQFGDSRSCVSENDLFNKLFPIDKSEALPAPFCNNANCAIKKSVWESIPYDETLTGLEDIDWAIKVMERGWDVAYAPEAGLHHIHEESFKQVFNRFRREAIAFKTFKFGHNFSFLEMLKQILNELGRDLRKCSLLDLKKAWEALNFRLASNWGAYRGLKGGAKQEMALTYPFVRSSSPNLGDQRGDTKHYKREAA